MTRIPVRLLQRTFASHALDLIKMANLVPCEVEDHANNYRCRIAKIVFDPFRIPEVNKGFQASGYKIDEGMSVIAVNDDDSILLWGGANSVFHLRKGQKIKGPFDEKHLAFNDISNLTARFKIKNSKAEIDQLIAQAQALQRSGGEE